MRIALLVTIGLAICVWTNPPAAEAQNTTILIDSHELEISD